jgi:hypothetical protein
LVKRELHELETVFGALCRKRFNSDWFKLGGLYEKHTVTLSNLGIISAFAVRVRGN